MSTEPENQNESQATEANANQPSESSPDSSANSAEVTVENLQALDDHLGKDKGLPPKDKLELRLELLGELGWEHWVANGKRLMLMKFPAASPPPYNV